MKLHKLTCYNFMPYKGRVVVDFPTDDSRNVMIVFGDNMRGKTSLLNALRWGFYGRAVGRHSRPIQLQEIVNKDATLEDDWRMEVFIEFDANGHQYDLRRSATRRSHVATPSRPEDLQVVVHLSRDGVQMRGDQIEAEIDQIAPEQISRFFLFDGELLGEYESLLIEGSEQGRQIREAIEQVLGVPALINGRTELGAILKSATKRQSSELSHIQGLEKQAERQLELTAKQDAYDRDLQELQGKLTRVRADRNKLDDDLEAAASVLAAKGKLDALLVQKTSLEEIRERKRTERQQILAQAWHDLLDVKLEVKRAQLQKRQTVLTQGLKEQGRLQSRIEDLAKLLQSNECPTCGQDLGGDRRSHLGASLGKLQAEAAQISDENDDLQSVSAQLASLNRIRGVNARERLREIDKDARAAEVELQRVENEIERLKDEIAGQDTAELARKRVLQIEALKEEGRLTQSITNVRRDIDKIKEELAVAQKAIESLAPARSKRSTLKVSIATDLERTFSASIEELRDRLRERVGSLANDAFKEMTTQKEYRGLEINSNYGLSIVDGAGRKVPLRSAGAEQVVALSLIDGLNRTGRGVGPVVMDTPFGRLDLKHRDNRHLPKVEVLQRVSDEAEDIIATGPPGRQWHASEILSALVERDSSNFSGEAINKYIVDVALRKSGDLKRLGRMIWKEVDAGEGSRIDVRQAIISLLEQAGRPLQTDEIRQRLIALRGVNEHFQIAMADPVLRVGVGLWGLNDRDISIKRPNQPRLLDGLVTILKDRGIGIHVSELERSSLMSVSGLSAQSLFSLARADSRLQVNSGQYLYLDEWGGPRRESMSEAVAAVLTPSTPPLALEEILLQVEKRMRRVCDRRSLTNCLHALEVEMDPSTEKWSFNPEVPLAEEELALSA